MFAQRRAGHSLARITRALNDAGIPCPSAADPERNPHRSGRAWTLFTVRAILANPRYTGRQVWNRQPTSHELIDPANTGLGHRQVQRWPSRKAGSSPTAPRTRHWSARKTSSQSRASARNATQALLLAADICWQGCCGAGPAAGGWSPAGRTTGLPTGAGTATPARRRPIRPGRRTSMYARTGSCRICLLFTPSSPEGKLLPGG